MRQKLLLSLAVVFGVLAFVLTYQQIKRERERALGAAREVVLVKFKRDMTEGEQVTVNDIAPSRQRRFKGNISSEVLWTSKDRIVGHQLALPVNAGETLKWNYLKQVGFRSRDGLSGVIDRGWRAVSISVDATSSVTGLVRPGNHVDLIGTFRFPEMKGDRQFDTLTLTILQNVVVLATGTDYSQAPTMTRAGMGRSKSYSTVTLELTPKEVEMIIFAAQKGKIHLSLRSVEDTQVEARLQSVNFKYLEENVGKYTSERQEFMRKRSGLSGRR